jgi:hypothetical protein
LGLKTKYNPKHNMMPRNIKKMISVEIANSRIPCSEFSALFIKYTALPNGNTATKKLEIEKTKENTANI